MCKGRRKLIFIDGQQDRAPCLCRQLVRRRFKGKQPAPAGGAGSGIREVEVVQREDPDGHVLMAVGDLIFCLRCGSSS